MQMHWRWAPHPAVRGELTALHLKLAFSKTAHLEMLRLQNGLLRHSSIPRTPEKKLEGTLLKGAQRVHISAK